MHYIQRMSQKRPNFTSTREAVLWDIERFLEANPHISAESFGWFSVRQVGVVKRLRAGKDITTRNLDGIIAYLQNPVTTLKKETAHGTQSA